MDHDYRVVLRHFVWETYILFRRVITYVRLFVKTFFFFDDPDSAKYPTIMVTVRVAAPL